MAAPVTGHDRYHGNGAAPLGGVAVLAGVAVLLLAALSLLVAGCGESSSVSAPTTGAPGVSEPMGSTAPSVSVRVEYPTTPGHVEVRAVPADKLTPQCLTSVGVARVIDQAGRVGYATASDLPAPPAAVCATGHVGRALPGTLSP